MSYFLGVIFLCVGEKCMFWKSNDLFYSEIECDKVIAVAMKELEKQKIHHEGACLKINTKNNT